MAKNQDKIILSLKKKIEDKKSGIKDLSNLKFKTNCIMTFKNYSNTTYNLHVLKLDQLVELYADVNSFLKDLEQVNNLDVIDTKNLITYYESCLHDINIKIKVLNVKKEKEELLELEKKLDSLLSEEYKNNKSLSELEKVIEKL